MLVSMLYYPLCSSHLDFINAEVFLFQCRLDAFESVLVSINIASPLYPSSGPVDGQLDGCLDLQ